MWRTICQTFVLHLTFKATHKMLPGSIPQVRSPRILEVKRSPQSRSCLSSRIWENKTSRWEFLSPDHSLRSRWAEAWGAGVEQEKLQGFGCCSRKHFLSAPFRLLPGLLPCKAPTRPLRAAPGVPGGRHGPWKCQPRILPVGSPRKSGCLPLPEFPLRSHRCSTTPPKRARFHPSRPVK